MFTLDLDGKIYNLVMDFGYSLKGNLYIILNDAETFEPFAYITKLLPFGIAEANLQYVDSNNLPWVLDFIKKYELGVVVGSEPCGFCEYPLVLFDVEKFKGER